MILMAGGWVWCVVAFGATPGRPRLRRVIVLTGGLLTIAATSAVVWGTLEEASQSLTAGLAASAVACIGSVAWLVRRPGLAAMCWIVLLYLAMAPLGVAGPIVAAPLAVGMSAVALSEREAAANGDGSPALDTKTSGR